MNDGIRELFEDLEFAARRRVTHITGSSGLQRCGKKRLNLKFRGKIQEIRNKAEREISLLLIKATDEARRQEPTRIGETFFSAPWFFIDRPKQRPLRRQLQLVFTEPDEEPSDDESNNWLFKNWTGTTPK